jgi:hypothetical protein
MVCTVSVHAVACGYLKQQGMIDGARCGADAAHACCC